VLGVAIDHCGKCRHLGLPYDITGNWSDPDRIGGIRATGWCQRDDPALLAGDFDVMVGKNYDAPWVLRKRTDVPKVYLTSGVDFISRSGKPYHQVQEPPPEGNNDFVAFGSADHVLVHSTIDLAYYRKYFPAKLVAKIHRDSVIYTPDIAVPPINSEWARPYRERQFGLCFSASDWGRRMKNRGLLEAVARRFPQVRIAVCGDRLNLPLPNVIDFGLVDHATMLTLLGNSRVVVIPSMYDPSPNLYAEAAKLGCNVVVSTNVGNIDKHPPPLCCPDLSIETFAAAITHALAEKQQLRYRKVDPMGAAEALLACLRSVCQSKRRKTWLSKSTCLSTSPRFSLR